MNYQPQISDFNIQYFIPFILYKQDPKVFLQRRKTGKIHSLIEIILQQNPNLRLILAINTGLGFQNPLVNLNNLEITVLETSPIQME